MLSPVKTGLLVMAAAAGTIFVSGSAEAGRLFRFHFFEPTYYNYYPAPDEVYAPDYGYAPDYYYVPRHKRRHAYDQYDQQYQQDLQNQQDGYYDPQFNDPVYVKPHKKKLARVAPVAPVAPVAGQPVKKPVVATVKKPATVASQTTTGGMSCDKAGNIVSSYGFTGVKAASCEGQVYAFNASRSGKNYLISLNAASGELTEVKKVQ
jgi:hypothetical protein